MDDIAQKALDRLVKLYNIHLLEGKEYTWQHDTGYEYENITDVYPDNYVYCGNRDGYDPRIYDPIIAEYLRNKKNG